MLRVGVAEEIQARRFLMILIHYIWFYCCRFLLCFTGACYNQWFADSVSLQRAEVA